jgi:hypothetical protein
MNLPGIGITPRAIRDTLSRRMGGITTPGGQWIVDEDTELDAWARPG